MTVVITPHCFTGIIRIPAFTLDNQSISHKAVYGSPPEAFLAAAAVISNGSVTLLGLDPEPAVETEGIGQDACDSPQIDMEDGKVFFNILEKMNCKVQWEQIPMNQVSLGDPIIDELHPFGLHALGVQIAKLHFAEWQLSVSRKGPIFGGEFDLNETPGFFPLLAAVACFARGDTAIMNVGHARTKEIDYISVMAEELGKLGIKTTERHDGLVIHGSGGVSRPTAPIPQSPLKIDGRNDPNVAMALACIALGYQQPLEIAGAESAAVTYPGFLEMLQR